MRVCRDADAKCSNCGNTREQSLEMFDLCIGRQIMAICDMCNNRLFQKTLAASCSVDHKTKSESDMKLIRSRKRHVAGDGGC